MARPKLALVDGHAVAFRAFHALRDADLRTKAGEPTFAIFGFCQIVLTALQQLQPDYAAVSFDVGRTFRDDLYEQYKANRTEPPSEFHQQLERIKQIVQALNIPIYTAEGYEADDVIGTLARQATAQGADTYIITGDSDTLQLVDDHVRVLLAVPYGRKQEAKEYDLQTVAERYKGLRPAQLADLRGLKGDATDNIPGVKGIGETGAISLLNQFGTIEGIYERLDEVPARYRKALEGRQEQALFSKQLATITCDAPVQLDLQQCRLDGYDREAVIAIFQELEFNSLLRKLPSSKGASTLAGSQPAGEVALPPMQQGLFDTDEAGEARPTALVVPNRDLPAAQGDYSVVGTPEALQALVKQLKAAPAFAFDTETTSLAVVRAEVVGLSFAVQPGQAWYVPIGHKGSDVGPQLDRTAAREALGPLLEDGTKPKIVHNGKFDMLALRTMDILVQGLQFDTMIAAVLLGHQSSKLKDLAFNVLRLPDLMIDITDLIGSGRNQISFDYVPIERAAPYAAADADMTLRLSDYLARELDQQPRIRDLFQTIEMPLVPVLTDMEWHGVKVDVQVLRQLSSDLERRLQELEAEIYKIADMPFNIGSGQQLNMVLFEKLQLPTQGLSKTKTGLYSITAEVLEKLRGVHPIIGFILEHRRLSKLKSTYIDALPSLVDERQRVHTDYRQLGTETGRLSSTSPNLQNIPVRTEQGREIRRAFVAEDRHHLLAADYSQIELRILAHMTQDSALLEAFRQGRDIHAATAARLFSVPMNQVNRNQRRIAKCVAAGTLVSTERGIVPIEQLGDAALGKVVPIAAEVAQEGAARAQATGFYNDGMQPTIRITTQHGYVLEATAQHRVRSLDEHGTYIWRELGTLEPGIYVALARGAMLFGSDRDFDVCYMRRQNNAVTLPTRMTPAFARFLGYFIAEGNIIHGPTSSSLFIHNADPDVRNDLYQISAEVFGILPRESIDRNGVTKLSWHISRLVDLIEYLGAGAAQKRIPDAIMQGSYETATQFLRAFFEGDGPISASFISAASKSRQLIQQLQALLLNLGIACHLEQRDVPGYGCHYELRLLGDESRVLFAKHIGFVSQRKQQRLDVLMTRKHTNEPITLPFQQARLLRLYPETKCGLKETIDSYIRTKSPAVGLTYQRLVKILDQFPEADDVDVKALQAHQERNLFYDRVVSVAHSHSQVYDLVVPVTNTYIANGFVSHNTTVFGTIYGISAFGLAARTDLSRDEAQRLIDGLFETYPGIKRLFEQTLAFGREHGYVETLFGRRRYFGSGRDNALTASHGSRRMAAEREAINAPLQGTSADLIKLAMVRLFHELQRGGYAAKMMLQVHDELLLEVPDDELEEVKRLVRRVMEGVYRDLLVPLEVEISAGRNWDQMS